jgi:acyl-CoA reductase-like NAD-dependent aldehyde dehydrogenase
MGETVAPHSPLDDAPIQKGHLLDSLELERLTASSHPLLPIAPSELQQFGLRLYAALYDLRLPLMEAMQYETGFLPSDCEELLTASLEYVRGFRPIEQRSGAERDCAQEYRLASQMRQIRLVRCAWGTIAVILPQNAFLLLAVTCLLNALAAGNRVALRTPLQSIRSAALLAMAVEAAQPPQNAVSLVLSRAKAFLEAVYRSSQPFLIHYLGSSQHAAEILSDSFRHGKAVLMDGEGNTWMWVGEDACAETSAALLTAGALRYNGQTCTSINGALIHPAQYASVRARLLERWNRLEAGNPVTAEVPVGPLFDEAQAQWCERQISASGASLLCGGERRGNLLSPTLIENPSPSSALVAEGLFGPGLWIAPADRQTYLLEWRRNRYPLCAGILSASEAPHWWLQRMPNLARLVMNGDPSREFIYEPWGGYPASGMNPVGIWQEKYQRVVQLDAPAADTRTRQR